MFRLEEKFESSNVTLAAALGERLPGPAGLPAACSCTSTRIETNHYDTETHLLVLI